MKKFIKTHLVNSVGRLNSRKLNIEWFEKNNFVDEYHNLYHLTAFAPDHHTIGNRVHTILNDIKRNKICTTCGAEHLRIVNRNMFSEYCSNRCAKSSDEKKHKTEKTNLQRFGFKYYTQTPEGRQAISNAQLESWKNISSRAKSTIANQRHIPDNILTILDSKKLLAERLVMANGLVQALAIDLDVYYGTIINRLRKYDMYHGKYVSFNTSAGEQDVANFITSLGIDIIQNQKLDGKEIDICIPDHNLAIEFDGIYWHSEVSGKKKSQYHLDKTILCDKHDMQLMHIFDNEWQDKKIIWQSVLKSKLGINQRIGARQCSIQEVMWPESSEFLDANHLQGKDMSHIRYGLYLNDELLSLMTFSRSRYNVAYDYEIARFCNRIGYNVMGAASRLLARFAGEHTGNVVSYANRRWSDGKLYDKMGFEFVHDSKPNFFVTKDHYTLESRLKYQKHKLENILDVYDGDLSAWKNLQINGYDRIWDCGNKVYSKKI